MALQTVRFGSDPQLTAASENNPPLKVGAKGEGVAILQQTLVDLGFAMPISMGGGSNLPDGIYGAETARTVSAFQKAQGLTQDGIAGRQTLKRLEELLIAEARLEDAAFVAEMQGPPSRRRIVSGSPKKLG